jgi:hypothetical protein
MNVLRDFLATLYKMFAADLPMTMIAIGVVILCAALLAAHLLTAGALPYVLTAGILAALSIAVWGGARR